MSEIWPACTKLELSEKWMESMLSFGFPGISKSRCSDTKQQTNGKQS